MSNKLDKIRAILAEQEAKSGGNTNRSTGPNDVYPFWKMDTGSSSLVRFLPDGNTKNPLIWVENQNIRLSFPGIKGQPQSGPVEFKVPCVEMWGLSCPILGRIRKEQWFQDSDTEQLGRQYWKKRSWIFQGFVIEDGIPENEDETPENPIRRFVMGKQLFENIREGFTDPDLEESPDDYDAGTDFLIKKSKQGDYPSYTTSKFKNKPRSLSEAERAAIEEYGLSDLSQFQPKKPTDDELDAIFEMFEASVEGEFYDPDKWGYLPWRPYGVEANSGVEVPKPSAPAKAKSETVDEDDDNDDEAQSPAPAAKKDSTGSGKSAEEILAKLRAKNNS